MQVPAKDATVSLESVPANAVVELDGDRVSVAREIGKPLLIDALPGRHAVVVRHGDEILLAESVSLLSGTQVNLVVRATGPTRRGRLSRKLPRPNRPRM